MKFVKYLSCFVLGVVFWAVLMGVWKPEVIVSERLGYGKKVDILRIYYKPNPLNFFLYRRVDLWINTWECFSWDFIKEQPNAMINRGCR